MSAVPCVSCSLVIIGIWEQKVLIIVQEHHFFGFTSVIMLSVIVVRKASVASWVILIGYTVLVLAVFLQLFQLISVCSADELSVHVEDLTLWVHQELTVVALDLDSSHDHIVFHINADLLGFSVGIRVPIVLSVRLSSIFIIWGILLIWIEFLLIMMICVLMLSIRIRILKLLLLIVAIFDVHLIVFPALAFTTINWNSVMSS